MALMGNLTPQARLLVKNPYREATALVTVERGGVLYHRVVHLQGKFPVVELPVEDNYFPNAFISVHLLRGRVELTVQSGAKGEPESHGPDEQGDGTSITEIRGKVVQQQRSPGQQAIAEGEKGGGEEPATAIQDGAAGRQRE